MNKIWTTHSEEETMALGAELVTMLHAGNTVSLEGDLGAGKTVISRGFARALGILEAVTSPTFTVVQEYQVPKETVAARKENLRYFFHLDMYRIDNENAALAFGIEDFLFAHDAITFVEWPIRIDALLPKNRTCRLIITPLDHDCRRVEFIRP